MSKRNKKKKGNKQRKRKTDKEKRLKQIKKRRKIFCGLNSNTSDKRTIFISQSSGGAHSPAPFRLKPPLIPLFIPLKS